MLPGVRPKHVFRVAADRFDLVGNFIDRDD